MTPALPFKSRTDQLTEKVRTRLEEMRISRSKTGRYGEHGPTPTTDQPSTGEPPPSMADSATGPISSYLLDQYQHFNAMTTIKASLAWRDLVAKGGQMFLSLAGAMSTAGLGRSLAPLIRAGKLHGLSVTGANLEEDLFLLVGRDTYQPHPEYHGHTPADDASLGDQGLPRVTDVSIPEDRAMKPVEEAARAIWTRLQGSGARAFPHEVLYEIVRAGTLANQYQGKPAHSWLVAAAEQNLPLFVPGWEDSTLGNMFAAECIRQKYEPTLIKGGIEYMDALNAWYAGLTSEVGFFQIGGGIAGDFAICVVPMRLADLKQADTKRWAYFAQITDADESYGGYSGALPNEKASWQKIGPDTPMFNIKSDASLVFPLISALVLGL